MKRNSLSWNKFFVGLSTTVEKWRHEKCPNVQSPQKSPKQNKITKEVMPRGNGIIDRALACCAAGLGSIPAVGKSNVCLQYSDGFSPSRYKVVGKKWSQTPDK